MGAPKSIYNPANEEAIAFLRMLYGNKLTERPKERDERSDDHCYDEKSYAWTFIGLTDGPRSKEIQYSVGVRSYQTLEKYIYDDKAVFITPNQFISRTKRTEAMTEWMNAMVVDFDDTQNVVDAMERMKLPGRATPTLVNKTTKGLHFWYVFDKPVKATLGNQGRYKTIARAMAVTAGADLQCPSPTQYFRIPRNIQLSQLDARVNFYKLYNWALVTLRKHRKSQTIVGSPEQLMKTVAFTKLLSGVAEGGRNTAAYSIAMVYRNADLDKTEALDKLFAWNERNDPPLKQKAIKDVVECVYKKKADKRLPLNNIRTITGCKFKFGRIITQRKERSDRKRTHYSEWQQDLQHFISDRPDQYWIGSQKTLAEETGIPLRSLKDVLQRIRDGETTLQIRTEGTGCKAKTILFVSHNEEESDFVPQVVPQNDSEDVFVVQNSEFVPQITIKNKKVLDFVVQNSKAVPQNMSKKREEIKVVQLIIRLVPQERGDGELKMRCHECIEIREVETVRCRNKGSTAGGWLNHPRRGYLSKGVVVCRTRRGLSPQPCT